MMDQSVRVSLPASWVGCCLILLCCAASATASDEKEVTFKRDSLSGRGTIKLQPGSMNVIPLNMIDAADSTHCRINDPPPFPLIATLRYQTQQGQEKEAFFENAYRC